MEPDGVDHEDSIVEDVLKAGKGNQHLPKFSTYVFLTDTQL